MEIEQQYQFDDESCIAACVAMILGEQAEDLRGFHECYFKGGVRISHYIRKRGIQCFDTRMDHELRSNVAYIAICPSLNQFGKLHAVVINIDENFNMEVFDPWLQRNAEKPMDYFYVSSQKPNIVPPEVRLTSYIPIVVVYWSDDEPN